MRKLQQSKSDEGSRQQIRSFLEKIVIDAGIGRLSSQPNFDKTLAQVERDLSLLAGQKPQARPTRKSIAGFKIREGQIVGLRVTMRRKRMVDFFERLVKIVLPRVKDFHGIKLEAIDRGGALNIGLREQFVFPEVSAEQSPVVFSLGISTVPRLRSREKAIEKYRELGVPLKKS